MRELPAGTVTFLFSDIEGSTELLHALGDQYADALAEQRRIVRAATAEASGVEVDTQGDAFFLAFARAGDAVRAAAAIQRGLAAVSWPQDLPVRVRIGLHSGEPLRTEEGYVGVDVHRGARICSAAHGGQVLVSQTTGDLVEAGLTAGLDLRDLGPHRLKDLTEPQRLFQLDVAGLPAEFPPPRTLDARRTNLPVQATAFVGRRREVAELSALLSDPHVRLVTLTGPGGTGKTRLALQAAASCADAFADGTYFVPLAAVRSPDLVATAIAQALGLRENGERSTSTVLAEGIGEQELLLVVDNLEHVISAASDLPALLATAPCLTILATSRERLRLAGEQLYPVAPLALPDPARTPDAAALTSSDAAVLLLDRARALEPSLVIADADAAAIAEVCVRLDGLPLALELAAARLPMLGARGLLRRLERRLPLLTRGARDLDERQRALRATIDWSHDLLDADERLVFARLATFVGGCTLDAAEAVAGGGEVDVLDVLSSLVDKSLVRRRADEVGEPRFGLLETIREYASELIGADKEATQRRHATYYAALAATAAPALEGPEQGRWLDRIEADHPNLRATIAWCGAHDLAAALRLVADLVLFWSVRGHLREGRGLCQAVLERDGEQAPQLRADALGASAYIKFYLGDDAGFAEAEEGLALYRTLGDARGEGRLLKSLALATELRDEAAAVPLYQRAVEVSRRAGDTWNLAIATNNLGNVALARDDLDVAAAWLEESLAMRRAIGDQRGLCITLETLGVLGLSRGRPEEAVTALLESTRLATTLGFKEIIAADLDLLAVVAEQRRDDVVAGKLFGAAAALTTEVGVGLHGAELTVRDEAVARLRSRTDPAWLEAAWAEGAALSIAEAIDYAEQSVRL